MGQAFDKTIEELGEEQTFPGLRVEEWYTTKEAYFLHKLHRLERKVDALVADLTGVEAAVTAAVAAEQAGATELQALVAEVASLQATIAGGGTITQAQLDSLASALSAATTTLTSAEPTPAPAPEPTPAPSPAPEEPPTA